MGYLKMIFKIFSTFATCLISTLLPEEAKKEIVIGAYHFFINNSHTIISLYLLAGLVIVVGILISIGYTFAKKGEDAAEEKFYAIMGKISKLIRFKKVF